MREVALVREASARGDLCQGEVVILSKELLRTLDATGDDVLVWRLSRRDLELPREVVGAEMGGGRHVLQGQAGVKVLLDVLDYRTEPHARERSVALARGLTGGGDVSDQLDSQEIGQGLGGERPAGASSGEFGVHSPHRSPEVREVETVKRWDSQPRRVEVERLGCDPRDQPRI